MEINYRLSLQIVTTFQTFTQEFSPLSVAQGHTKCYVTEVVESEEIKGVRVCRDKTGLNRDCKCLTKKI